MALDGLYLSCLRREIAASLAGARIDKVFQPTREELVLAFRSRTGTYKLYISARVDAPRIHFTDIKLENPASPPMFCMLLRRRLTGGRFAAVRQDGLERVLYLDFDCVNELGDIVRLTVAAESMGKHSNIVLIDAAGKVVDALKRVDLSMSATRPLLPGAAYLPPPALSGHIDILAGSAAEILTAARATGKPLAAALLAVTRGISPLVCREIAVRAAGDTEVPADALTVVQTERLTAAIDRVRAIAGGDAAAQPFLVSRDGVPLEYSCMPLLQYGPAAEGREMESFSAVLDAFYRERDAALRLRQRTAELHRVLTVSRERLARKLSHQRAERKASGERELLRVYADLINANIHAIPKGAQQASLINYYAEDCAPLTVPLDPSLSAAANAQKYYKAYRKAQTAERVLAEQIEKGEAELAYLETVADALSRAATAAETAELRRELEEGGYVRAGNGKQKPPAALPPKTFVSDDGFTILVGRSNVQNDRLTTKTARRTDIWFHTKNIPGSHVILLTEGKTPPDRTLEQAAVLAALHSRAAASRQVPVDYTPVGYVHKPAGARPGFVIYDTNRTAYVDPDPALAARLARP